MWQPRKALLKPKQPLFVPACPTSVNPTFLKPHCGSLLGQWIWGDYASNTHILVEFPFLESGPIYNIEYSASDSVFVLSLSLQKPWHFLLLISWET